VTFGTGPACAYRLAARAQAEDAHRIEVVFPRRAAPLDGDGAPVPISERTHVFTLRMAGEHNARNAVAAIAAAAEMGIAIDRIREGLAGVEASDMRLERVEIAGRTVFNDAYNANPDAMIASLRAFGELSAGASRRVAILGEMRELGPDARALHEEVGSHAGRLLGGRDALVAVGPHAEALVAAARVAGFAGESAASTVFSPAFAADAAQLMPRGAVILLKGSRGARMERFLEPLGAAFAAAATGA
jgi:UDP-N-acetylmuramoyl-tripeptide--D-alanyl-D-alanine ligase